MFRFEIGARILVRRHDWERGRDPIEVKIMAKAPNMIKALVLSDGWFPPDEVHWLSSNDWFVVSRVTEE